MFVLKESVAIARLLARSDDQGVYIAIEKKDRQQ